MKSFFFIKYFVNSLLFFFFVKKGKNIDSYLKWNNDYNDFVIKIFFISRIIPSIFFFYYNKFLYIFSHVSFAVSTIFKFLQPFVILGFKFLGFVLKSLGFVLKFGLKFVMLFLLYFTPIVYEYSKTNLLCFLKIVKQRKLFFINNLYNSFSSKILLSGTAFFSIYILIFIFLLIIVMPLLVLKKQVLIISSLGGEIYFHNLVLTQIPFLLFLIFCFILFILLNVIHSFLAFLSLCYDYLLKKLNSENFFVLFIISSTTLQIFFKLLSLFFIL